ncbi:MAG: PilZ domain-containing protein [Candidatus Hydrogenedens sp.]|nr:PilZ domain-containing protein [Candidatus Hydrogenedentota bacterium]NLF57442.1 PilZ domain-containing protein [Candidatus Hydrogenedens sp.]
MSMKDTEQRASKRHHVAAHVEVRLERGVLVEGWVVDISEHGLLLATERSLPLDSRVRVLVYPGCHADEERFCCHGTVARLDLRGVAVAFDEMDNELRECLGGIIARHAGELHAAAR